MAEITLSYDSVLEMYQREYPNWNQWVQLSSQYGVDLTDPSTVIEQMGRDWKYKPQLNADGTVTFWTYNPDPITSTINNNPLNSNASTTTRTVARPAINSTIDATTQKPTFSLKPKVGQFTQNAMYFLGEASQAVAAASTGIALGKAIDSALYNVNPDFWDSVGMSGLDPSTWGAITNGDDSLGASLFNFIFGIDPVTNKTQAYMDADVFAYMSAWMNSAGVFDSGTGAVTLPSDFYNVYSGYSISGTIYAVDTAVKASNGIYSVVRNNEYPVYFGFVGVGTNAALVCASLGPFQYSKSNSLPTYFSSSQVTVNDFTFYVNSSYDCQYSDDGSFLPPKVTIRTPNGSAASPATWGYAVLKGTIASGGIEGITDQTGATLPDTSTWDTVPNTLTSLQSQYPDMFNNALQYDVLQPDGTVLTKTYVPVAMPDTNAQTSNTPWNDQQPTTSTQTQTDTEIDPSTSTKTLLDFITKILQQTQTLPETDTDNPTPTGTGTTDPPIPPVGVGSALWSVYNPTQAQINSFGGWLWSGDIITQIQQILQNPMEGIITLHKVFAPPVISGTGDIVVGRLSSGVSSNLVTNQYSYVDCGTVDLLEQFGNVFDYDPHTNVSLYLPFIGIVPLNTSDVMRGSINVKYGVDVFTGACLAMVTVTRDGNTVNMYQYSGVASVSYPLTGAQNSGLIGGLLSIAGGVASIATGNVVGGVLGAAGGVGAAAKSHMQRASSFSGNSGAMGIKIPYLIIERPQAKVANTFNSLQGYPTNTSIRLGDCSGQVRVRAVHVEGMGYATENEQKEIENLLYSGVLI